MSINDSAVGESKLFNSSSIQVAISVICDRKTSDVNVNYHDSNLAINALTLNVS
jgi:hypothetical protein